MPNIGGMAVLPQYQGSLYDLQRQQQLAQALMQNSLAQRPQQGTVGSGGSQNYQVMPRTSWAVPAAQLASALMGSQMGNQAGQGLNNLGAQQWQALVGSNPTQGFGASAPAMGGNASPLQSAPAEQPVLDDGAAGARGVSGQLGQTQGTPGMLSPGGPMNPLGMPVQQAAMMYLNSPDEYWKTQAGAYKQADIVSQMRAAGIDPSTPRGRQIAQTALANTLAPEYQAGRAGGYMLNRTTGQMQWMPAVPAGGMPVQDANGNFTGAVVPQPGAIGVEGSMSAAKASGPAMFDIQKGVDTATGRPAYATAYGIATGQRAPGAQSGSVNSGRFGGYQAPNSGAVSPGLAPGAEKLAEGSADSFNALRGAAASTPTAIDGYNKAEQALLDGVTTGPGSTLGANIIGRLNTAGIPLMQGDVTGYQSLQKFLANANAQAASASGYNGSDARFEAFSHGQPNTEAMNPQALRYAIQYVRGQQAGVQAKYQAAQAFLNQNGQSTVNYPQFEAQWNRIYSPDVMMVRSMPNAADQQAYLTDLKKQGKLDDFMKSYKAMQSMGAF
jgi:hypothetical protein